MLLLTTPGGVTVHGQGSETTRSEGRKEQQAQAPTSRQRREGQASTRDDRARIHLSRLKNWHVLRHPPLQHTSITAEVTSVFTVSPALSIIALLQ